MDCIIIDGYSVINAWNDIFDLNKDSLEDIRERFLRMVSNFQGYSKKKVIVVFDAHYNENSKREKFFYDNVEVVYTKKNESADIYIERYVYVNSSDFNICVVTADYLEQKTVLYGGGARVSPREFRIILENCNEECRDRVNSYDRKVKSEIDSSISGYNRIANNISSEALKKLDKLRKSCYIEKNDEKQR